MEIKDEHIREAEELLINGNSFDEKERIPFIKNLSTIDLLAVPGSGKTTALQAKLYCLSKQLPFDDGSGILVLSHTNAAVEEIEKNLKKLCPKLFEYPNFVGTVQSFVNRFLAAPYYLNKNNKKISSIDTGVYVNILRNRVLNKFDVQNEIKQLFRTPNVNWVYDFRIDKLSNGKYQISRTYSNETIEINKPKGNTKKSNYRDWSDADKKKIEQKLINLKSELLKMGVLSYEDAYFYGELFLKKYPIIKKILQERFKYVFVDEMQDLESFQIDLIEDIFDNGKNTSIIQRIGDVNQAIYSSGKKVKISADWQPRESFYCITGSNRLTPEVSSVVDFLTLDPQKDEKGQSRFKVSGLKKLNTPIKPHIIIYTDKTKDFLEEKFREVIIQHSLQDTNEGKKYGFKIIGWNAKWNDSEADHNGKLRLEDIFEGFKKERVEKREHFNTLSNYLQCFDNKKNIIKNAQDNILNALLSVLKLENITISVKRKGKLTENYYTKREMINKIKSTPVGYNSFKQNLYIWSFSLSTKSNYSEVYACLKNFIVTEFKDWFNLTLTADTKEFLGTAFEPLTVVANENTNLHSSNTIDIEIGTVHSAKGQTHCATMYVETSFYKYETEKLKVKAKGGKRILNNPLFKREHEYNSGEYKRTKEAVKMMYVGFSRPTHLLCFACLKENVCDDIELFKDAGWEIVDITEDSQK